VHGAIGTAGMLLNQTPQPACHAEQGSKIYLSQAKDRSLRTTAEL
jgi:hypothetical protein